MPRIGLIHEADCGYAVQPSDYNALYDIIVHKVLPNLSEFKKKGANGRKMYEREFMLDKCINHLEEIITMK